MKEIKLVPYLNIHQLINRSIQNYPSQQHLHNYLEYLHYDRQPMDQPSSSPQDCLYFCSQGATMPSFFYIIFNCDRRISFLEIYVVAIFYIQIFFTKNTTIVLRRSKIKIKISLTRIKQVAHYFFTKGGGAILPLCQYKDR